MDFGENRLNGIYCLECSSTMFGIFEQDRHSDRQNVETVYGPLPYLLNVICKKYSPEKRFSVGLENLESIKIGKYYHLTIK